jgi:Iap family predicted aminopeptidase
MKGEVMDKLEKEYVKSFVKKVDADYAWQTSDKVANTGLFRLGFRPSGTIAEHEAAEYIADEMKRIGLVNVSLEKVPLPAWSFLGAKVNIIQPENRTVVASTYAGCPGTSLEGVTGEVVYVGDGTRHDYNGLDVQDKVVMVNRTKDLVYSAIVYEAQLHGAKGVIVRETAYAKAPGAIRCNDFCGTQARVAVVNVSKDVADQIISWIKEGERVVVNLVVDAKVEEGEGYNVLGYLPSSEKSDRLIIVGAHHDSWFHGFADNAAGVGCMLTIAKALIESGYKPKANLLFISHTGEEFGALDTFYDWLIGSDYAVKVEHPDWAGRVIAYLNLDLSILANATAHFETTRELKAFTEKFVEEFKEEFRLPYKSVEFVSVPDTQLDQFSYAGVGISSMALILNGHYDDLYYHTQFDEAKLVDDASLKVCVLLFGIYIIELDNALVLPFDLSVWGEELLAGYGRTEVGLRLDLKDVMGKMEKFADNAKEFSVRVEETCCLLEELKRIGGDYKSAKNVFEKVNGGLLEIAKLLNAQLNALGGVQLAEKVMLPHEQYLKDILFLRETVEAIKKKEIESALTSLAKVGGVKAWCLMSRKTFESEFLKMVDLRRKDLYWGTGHIVKYVDLWNEYNELKEVEDESKTKEILKSLEKKHSLLLDYLKETIKIEEKTVEKANLSLTKFTKQVKTVISKLKKQLQ